MAGRRTEKKGSMALIVCVNDTATLPRLMFVKRLPMLWTIARGRIARSWKIRTITADVHLVTLCAYRKFI
jgi:ribosomal protein S26